MRAVASSADRLPARRAEPEPREVRQAQRPGAQAGAVAAPFAAGLRDVSERVGAGIVAIGVRRRTDADRVEHQDEGAAHATFSMSGAPMRARTTG